MNSSVNTLVSSEELTEACRHAVDHEKCSFKKHSSRVADIALTSPQLACDVEDLINIGARDYVGG